MAHPVGACLQAISGAEIPSAKSPNAKTSNAKEDPRPKPDCPRNTRTHAKGWGAISRAAARRKRVSIECGNDRALAVLDWRMRSAGIHSCRFVCLVGQRSSARDPIRVHPRRLVVRRSDSRASALGCRSDARTTYSLCALRPGSVISVLLPWVGSTTRFHWLPRRHIRRSLLAGDLGGRNSKRQIAKRQRSPKPQTGLPTEHAEYTEKDQGEKMLHAEGVSGSK